MCKCVHGMSQTRRYTHGHYDRAAANTSGYHVSASATVRYTHARRKFTYTSHANGHICASICACLRGLTSYPATRTHMNLDKSTVNCFLPCMNPFSVLTTAHCQNRGDLYPPLAYVGIKDALGMYVNRIHKKKFCCLVSTLIMHTIDFER